MGVTRRASVHHAGLAEFFVASSVFFFGIFFLNASIEALSRDDYKYTEYPEYDSSEAPYAQMIEGQHKSHFVLQAILTVVSIVASALVHFFALVAGAAAAGWISGANLNPAVSGLFISIGKLKVAEFVVYVIAQFLAAICAAFLTYLIFGSESTLSTPTLNPKFSCWQGLLVEAAGTYALCLVIALVGKAKNPSLAIGAVLGAVVLAGAYVTGASYNWARHFGPALISGTWEYSAWIYYVGPLIGFVLAGCTQSIWAQWSNEVAVAKHEKMMHMMQGAAGGKMEGGGQGMGMMMDDEDQM